MPTPGNGTTARWCDPPDGRVLVVGNLPYSVSKPIVTALQTARAAIDAMALMLQREVAERLAAGPGGKVYGALSVLTQAGCDVELALRVPPGAFRPPPQVDSAVVRLTPRCESRVPAAMEARFREVVRAAFGRRRKTLPNALNEGLRHTAGAGAGGHHDGGGGPRATRRNPDDRRVCCADRSAIMKSMSRRGVLLIVLGVVTLAATWLGVFSPAPLASGGDPAPASAPSAPAPSVGGSAAASTETPASADPRPRSRRAP